MWDLLDKVTMISTLILNILFIGYIVYEIATRSRREKQ